MNPVSTGYFPYDLKKDYPDGVMLKVVDRSSQTYALWQAPSDTFRSFRL